MGRVQAGPGRRIPTPPHRPARTHPLPHLPQRREERLPLLTASRRLSAPHRSRRCLRASHGWPHGGGRTNRQPGAPDLAVPDTFWWMTMRQLASLLRQIHYVNIQARSSLTACLQSLIHEPERC
ncbi:NDP-hexose 2,3-dehydratase family protein [Streptomyces sp. Rer75]|uniref:NDP-hexose 2,3-dehydratase family protein n=1 Tax=unclassified Streptomyces TaxID=2593676 RepID=UPI0015D0B32F|nr:NDP-hexose 2,3-dehydratase family protein [Streptomyces sp. Rer75]QLH19690.1 NDP-hexose 2,3-dehydratase family protein [Streptomyces sp. Rer75]